MLETDDALFYSSLFVARLTKVRNFSSIKYFLFAFDIKFDIGEIFDLGSSLNCFFDTFVEKHSHWSPYSYINIKVLFDQVYLINF